MAPKPQIQSRVERDTKTQLEEYAGRNDLSQSEAVRQLVGRQLAAEGYTVAVTDGGATVTDRLDDLEEQQQQTSKTYTATLAVGLAYFLFSAVTGASSVAWGVLGIVLLLMVVLVTLARNMERGADE